MATRRRVSREFVAPPLTRANVEALSERYNEPDWLRRTIPMFADASIGCLQTRWGHTNRDYNSLTREEALAIDGHFIVEQTARSRSGLFLNFNGTAGLWRRTCIEDAGGWQPDTLTAPARGHRKARRRR